MLTKLFWIVLPVAALLPHEAMAQNIQSITCYGFGGSSCYSASFFQYSGNHQCSCAATCYNPPNNISAAYYVWWYCGSPTSGGVSGGALASGVRVEGFAGGFFGFSSQACDGSRDGEEFLTPC
jgi:hypothetical protein